MNCKTTIDFFQIPDLKILKMILKIKHLLTSTQPFYIQTANIILWAAISANTKKKETHVGMARMIYGDAEAAPALKWHGLHSLSISIFI